MALSSFVPSYSISFEVLPTTGYLSNAIPSSNSISTTFFLFILSNSTSIEISLESPYPHSKEPWLDVTSNLFTFLVAELSFCSERFVLSEGFASSRSKLSSLFSLVFSSLSAFSLSSISNARFSSVFSSMLTVLAIFSLAFSISISLAKTSNVGETVFVKTIAATIKALILLCIYSLPPNINKLFFISILMLDKTIYYKSLIFSFLQTLHLMITKYLLFCNNNIPYIVFILYYFHQDILPIYLSQKNK